MLGAGDTGATKMTPSPSSNSAKHSVSRQGSLNFYYILLINVLVFSDNQGYLPFVTYYNFYLKLNILLLVTSVFKAWMFQFLDGEFIDQNLFYI